MGAIDKREERFETACRVIEKRGGRELFGELSNPEMGVRSRAFERALGAYRRSLIGSDNPTFWFEAPLAGERTFDLHVYFDRPNLAPGDRFVEGDGFGRQGIFDWYIERETGGIGLGFAHDLSGLGEDDVYDGPPALYVNVNNAPLTDEAGLFESAGCPDEFERYQQLRSSLPEGWRVWYIGLFDGRPRRPLRLGSFVSSELKAAYAQDISVLERDLRAIGFEALDGEMLSRLQRLAGLPQALELQMDIYDDGTIGDSLPVSMGTSPKRSGGVSTYFSEGLGADLMSTIEEWGLADERWRALDDITFAIGVPEMDDGEIRLCAVGCSPAFVKLKWENCRPLPAKAYLHCFAQPIPT